MQPAPPNNIESVIMTTPEAIAGYLRAGLTCQHLEVRGDGHHFEAVIVCEAFGGKSRVARHQAVYAVLGDRMREEIHALSMKTFTPEEWNEARSVR